MGRVYRRLLGRRVGLVLAAGHHVPVAAAAAHVVVALQLVEVIPGAQVRHALVIHVVQLGGGGALTGLQLAGAVLLSVRQAVRLPVGKVRQHRHAGVQRVSVAGRVRVLVGVLVGQQGEEALAGLLGDAPRPGEAVRRRRRRRRRVAVGRRGPRRQEWRVGLLPDDLQTQVLLVGESRRVVQHHGPVVLFAAAQAAAHSAAAAAAAASRHAAWNRGTGRGQWLDQVLGHFNKKQCYGWRIQRERGCSDETHRTSFPQLH